MTSPPAKKRPTDQRLTVPTPATKRSADQLARRQTADHAAAGVRQRRADAALQARLADMPAASAELARRVAACQRLRETGRCPGRCVVSEWLPSELHRPRL